MNDDQINDLKQFISTITEQAVKNGIAETEQRLTQRIENLDGKFVGLERQLERLRQEMHDGFDGVGEAIGRINDTLDNYDKRITKLEQQTA